MGLYGEERDISFMRHINRELMGNIISQQASFYKPILNETQTNIYGEGDNVRYWDGPILFNSLITRNDQSNNTTDIGPNFEWDIKFAFLNDDLRDKEYVPEIGDVILYNESFFEVNNIIENQLTLGKDPSYPNGPNPLNPSLERFGWSNSSICVCNYVSREKIAITPTRL